MWVQDMGGGKGGQGEAVKSFAPNFWVNISLINDKD